MRLFVVHDLLSLEDRASTPGAPQGLGVHRLQGRSVHRAHRFGPGPVTKLDRVAAVTVDVPVGSVVEVGGIEFGVAVFAAEAFLVEVVVPGHDLLGLEHRALAPGTGVPPAQVALDEGGVWGPDGLGPVVKVLPEAALAINLILNDEKIDNKKTMHKNNWNFMQNSGAAFARPKFLSDLKFPSEF